MDTPVIIESGKGEADCCVIWLHGLGADGHDFESIVPELRLPTSLKVKFIFPHAPMIPVTINNGFIMRAWYDIVSMDIGSAPDEAGIRSSQQWLEELIRHQIAEGFASQKIVLAGFSQGGAIILQTGLRFSLPLAGLMALSTYLPLAESLELEKSDANQKVPIFMAHGDSDPVVRPELAYRSRSKLEQQGYTLDWQEYRGMQHGLCMQEIEHISEWLQRVLS
ncbi:MAG: prolyl oligopeptidase family serine peptidase [Gammaproteobacteria bacterium]|nr:prolyl oligopeptidase family serine peptidase [Gammaproteobacteria bacterium]